MQPSQMTLCKLQQMLFYVMVFEVAIIIVTIFQVYILSHRYLILKEYFNF
jgi:hypothetical protein